MLRSKLKNKKGFSMIELMVALVILGILVGLFMMNYKQSVRRKEFDTTFDKVVALVKEAQAKGINYGKYPAGATDLGDSKTDSYYCSKVLVIHNRDALTKSEWRNVEVILDDIQMRFNFQSPPLEESAFSNFQGVALLFPLGAAGAKPDYSKGNTLVFLPNGSAGITTGGSLPGTSEYIIQLELVEGDGSISKWGTINIDIKTGKIKTVTGLNPETAPPLTNS
ncbi:MAG: type IV pilin protein [Vulcanimicrobiota bacterium]